MSEHYAYPFTVLKDVGTHLTSLSWYSVSEIYHIKWFSDLHLHPVIILDLCSANICSYKAPLLELQSCALFPNLTAGHNTWGVSQKKKPALMLCCLSSLFYQSSYKSVVLIAMQLAERNGLNFASEAAHVTMLPSY